MLKLNPLKNVSESLQDAYRLELAKCIRGRVGFFSLAIWAIYSMALFVSGMVPSGIPLELRLRLFGLMTAGTAALLVYNQWLVRCVHTAKVSAFLFITFVLFLQCYGPSKNPAVFTYATFILTLLFSVLSFPWFLRDALVVTGLHFGAWAFYCASRDFSRISIPPTVFGADPVVNGMAFISLAAIMCLLIRIKDNQRDIENFLLLKEVQAKNEQMERELRFASKIQDSLVPRPLESAHADVFVTYKPMQAIGGDYANFQMIDQNTMVFFIGDVTGHGVPAALMVNRLHTEFGRLAASGHRPGAILRDLDSFILKAFEGTSMYLTAFCGMIDFREKKIYYSNYGHPPQFIFRLKDAAVTALEPMTCLLGMGFGAEDALFESQIDYREGDLIFMFTDGVLEHKNSVNEQYGSGRLQQFIQTRSSAPPQVIHDALINDLKCFGPSDFKDDVFVISIHLKTPALAASNQPAEKPASK